MQARQALLLYLALLSMPLSAEDRVQPSLELLEYLGGWEDAQGNWIDPQELAAVDTAEKQDETGDEQENE